MNHFLVSVLGIVNGSIAIGIIVLFTTLGGQWWSPGQPSPTEGNILGAILGLVIAALVCGLLAIAISIEKSLKQIAGNTMVPDGEKESVAAPTHSTSLAPQAPKSSRWERTYGPTKKA